MSGKKRQNAAFARKSFQKNKGTEKKTGKGEKTMKETEHLRERCSASSANGEKEPPYLRKRRVRRKKKGHYLF